MCLCYRLLHLIQYVSSRYYCKASTRALERMHTRTHAEFSTHARTHKHARMHVRTHTHTWWQKHTHASLSVSTCSHNRSCQFCGTHLWRCYYYYYWSLLYSAILRSRADSLCSHVILHEWIAFYSAFLNIHRSAVLTALAVQWQSIWQPTQAPAVALFWV